MSRKSALFAMLMVVALLCASVWVPAVAEDFVLEEDGSKWYADRVVWPDGSVTPRVNHDSGETQEDSVSQPAATQNDDGSVTVVSSDGSREEELPRNDDGSVTVESGQLPIQEEQAPAQELTVEEWEERCRRIAERNGAYTPTAFRNEDGTMTEVTVVYMGTGRSLVEMDGERMFVNTVDLFWETEAPEDKVLATIYTPKTGHAVLRADKSRKSTALMQCGHRYVVRVLAVGKTWTFVDFAGTRGYILTSSLEFRANDCTEFRTGQVSFRGKTKGKNPVHVRSASGVQMEEYPQGTPLTIFSDDGKFCEIEVEGHHCFIGSQFVTYDDAEAIASAEP